VHHLAHPRHLTQLYGQVGPGGFQSTLKALSVSGKELHIPPHIQVVEECIPY